MKPKWSQHPGLHLILDKLHRRVNLTAEELQQLSWQIEDLQKRTLHESAESGRNDPAIVTATSANTLPGHATPEGTQRFAGCFGKKSSSFYNSAQGNLVSSVGIGTYCGAMDNETDASYAEAVHAALLAGVNLINSSLNYRYQQSERDVATGLNMFVANSGGSRDEIVVCTKGGYLISGAITAGTLGPDDVVGGMHSMAPAFLADQIERSRRNLGLQTIDVYYLHNPETQLDFISMPS